MEIEVPLLFRHRGDTTLGNQVPSLLEERPGWWDGRKIKNFLLG
jgi:hypothetical protein